MLLRNIAVALSILCFSMAAFSQPSQSGSGAAATHPDIGMTRVSGVASDERIDRALDTLQRTLALNPTQTKTIRDLARSRRDSFRAIREQAQPKFTELMTLLRQTDPDPAALGRVVIDLKAIHGQARMKQEDFEKEVFKILDPKQQETVTNLRKQAQTYAALRGIGLFGRHDFARRMFMTNSNELFEDGL